MSRFLRSALLPPALAATALLCSGAGAFDIYAIDGSGNNLANPAWGQAGAELLRMTPPCYDDGLSTPRGGLVSTLPSPRAISNAMSSQTGMVHNSVEATDWFWQWGQFIDHDLDLTGGASPAEAFNVAVPMGDPSFDPFMTGVQEIGLNRSRWVSDGSGVRQQVNEITAYIDASQVYGSDASRATTLRTGADGLLKMSAASNGESLMMLNTMLLPNANDAHIFPDNELFLSGDVRSNEQIGLTATHTLFAREHNRLSTELKVRLDSGDQALIDKRDAMIADATNGVDDLDDFLYESTRRVVGAYIQKITYEEYLPLLLGAGSVGAYAGYDDSVDASIANEFSTAAFRVGHTQLSPTLMRRNNDRTVAAGGDVPLMMGFFNPQELKDNGVDSLLMGLASQSAQEIDTLVIDDVRNFLFGPPGAGGFDLASLNIQRGRDHGVGSLNEVRSELGLTPHASFLDLAGGDASLASQLASVYASVDEVDLWIGGLAENQFHDSVLGETFYTIIHDQFARARDGDRLFYEGALEHILLLDPDFESTLLSDIIRRNSSMTHIQQDVFRMIPEPAAATVLLIAGALAAGRRVNRAA